MKFPLALSETQIDSVLSDIGADAVKTGMLANEEIIGVVSKKIKQYRVKKVVVDPVMVAKERRLPFFEKMLKMPLSGELIPLASVVTPNLMEASVLTGLKVNALEGMKKAAHLDSRIGTKTCGGRRAAT